MPRNPPPRPCSGPLAIDGGTSGLRGPTVIGLIAGLLLDYITIITEARPKVRSCLPVA